MNAAPDNAPGLAPVQALPKKRWRLAAALVDEVPFLPFYVGAAFLPTSAAEADLLLGDGDSALGLYLLASDLVVGVLGVLYRVLFMARAGARRGQTPGKQLCGIAVIDPSAASLPTRKIWIREVLSYFVAPLWYPLILVDSVWLLFDRRQRTLHDILAGTVVTATTERATAKPAYST